jgi:hypothetical protein
MEETIGGVILELEVCAPEIGRSVHPRGRSRYSSHSTVFIATPDSFIAAWKQMTESSSSNPTGARES